MSSRPTRARALAAVALLAAAGCAGLRAPVGQGGPGAGPDPSSVSHGAQAAAPGPPTQPGPPALAAAPVPLLASTPPTTLRCPAATAALPAGRFKRAGREVAVGVFCLDLIEVTVAAYERCVAAGGCRPAFETGEWPGMSPALRADSGRLCNQGKPGRALHPVNCVTFVQAARYCAWRGARLPTEGEFIWAARGGERGSRYPWGDAEPAGQACWTGPHPGATVSASGMTCPVGSHPAGDSPHGLKDLAGGVFEWLRAADGAAVARGGSFVDVLPQYLAADGERWAPAPERSGAIGFRCAAAPR
jgi:formylglycine-generating enzyme required for sulfatase activity